ncbi:SSU rRNA (adenine(1518)-N(6)/adenine(1519)-N(6))- dimethyltransferase [Clostridiaceae bacterium JG1575]|nr:SSU rRNA (adenine(1518)-N(6)/adenine(1519)-N(6))- dimethyltransferase [Clostridiaceae bacterium JG1575]
MHLNTRELVKKYNFNFTKSLGQNFLVDEAVVSDIIEGSGIGPEDHVLEIGPGVGSLTRALVGKAGKVTAIEIDDRLIPILREQFQASPHFEVIQGDVLKQDLNKLLGSEPIHVVANLPYYVTTPILLRLLSQGINWRSITIMIQKEVAERLTAMPGTKEYGALTLLVEYYAQAVPVRLVSPGCFIPRPKVESMVIRLDRRPEPLVSPKNEAFFFKVVRQSFAMRRKTLNNTLKPLGLTKEAMERGFSAAGIDPARRGETLTIDEFCALADALYEVDA